MYPSRLCVTASPDGRFSERDLVAVAGDAPRRDPLRSASVQTLLPAGTGWAQAGTPRPEVTSASRPHTTKPNLLIYFPPGISNAKQLLRNSVLTRGINDAETYGRMFL